MNLISFYSDLCSLLFFSMIINLNKCETYIIIDKYYDTSYYTEWNTRAGKQ